MGQGREIHLFCNFDIKIPTVEVLLSGLLVVILITLIFFIITKDVNYFLKQFIGMKYLGNFIMNLTGSDRKMMQIFSRTVLEKHIKASAYII